MAKNNTNNTTHTNDLESSGRLHDGYGYLVVTRETAKPIKFHDADPLPAIRARWLEARKDPQSGLLSFSGARRANTYQDDTNKFVTEISKVEGAGDVLASQVIAIRYLTPDDNHTEEALESIRAVHDLQAHVMAEAAEAAQDGGDGDDGDAGDDGDGDTDDAGAQVEEAELDGGFKTK